MRKFFFTFLVLTVGFLTGMAASQKGAIMFQTPFYHEINNISANGKWACGMFQELGVNRAFRWNLETNEIDYLGPKGHTSEAHGISNDGVTCGIFVFTEIDGGPCTTGGYWKDGKLYPLKDENGKIIYSTTAAITPDGQYIAGSIINGVDFTACVWKNGVIDRRLETIANGNKCYSSASAISDDGKIVAGFYKPGNRLPCYWDNTEMTALSASKSYDSGAISISSNKRYILARDAVGTFVYDLQTKERTDIPFLNENTDNEDPDFADPDDDPEAGYDLAGATQVLNDKTVILFEGKRLFKKNNGYVWKGPENFKTMKQWLKDNWNYEVPEKYTGAPSITRFSSDMKRATSLTYEGLDEYEDPRYCVLAFISDQEVNYARPMAPSATQAESTGNVTLNWKKPAANEAGVTGYRIYRGDRKIADAGPGENSYIDKNPGTGKQSYQVSAMYDTNESEKAPAEVTVKESYYAAPVRSFSTYQTNYNNVVLNWNKPNAGYDACLKLHNDQFVLPFGVNIAKDYWAAVKFDKGLVGCYTGNFEIKAIEFYPCQKVEKMTLSLSSDGQELAKQVIDQTKLVFGQSNVVKLNNPVAVPANAEVTVTFKIEQSDSGNSIGMAEDPAVEGGNLISEDGVEWITLTDLSGGSYTYNWMISMLLDTKAAGGAPSTLSATSPEVTGYKIYRNNEKIAEVAVQGETQNYGDNNVASGLHIYGIEAIYNSSKVSALKTSELFTRKGSVDRCPAPVNLNGVSEYGHMRLTWDMPENTEVGYTNWEYMQGTGYDIIDNWYYGVSFSAEKMKPLAGSKITRVNFLPLSQEVNYSIVIFENGTEIYSQEVKEAQENVGKVNRIKLTDPVEIQPYTEYTLAIRVSNSLNIQSVGVSVGSTYEGGMLLSETGEYFITNSSLETGNLMISMDVDKMTPGFNPGMTYKVYVDDVAEPQTLSENVFTKSTAGITEIKTVSLKVAAIYPNGEKMSEATTVTIDPAGISTEETVVVKVYPNPATSYVNIEGNVTSAALFDMSGREVTRIENANSMEVGSYAAGSYLLRSVIDGKVYTNKIQLVK